MKPLTTHFPQRKLHGSNGIAADVRQNLKVMKTLLGQGTPKEEIYSFFPHSPLRVNQYVAALLLAPKKTLEHFWDGKISFATLQASCTCPVRVPLINYIIETLLEQSSTELLTAGQLVQLLKWKPLAKETLMSGCSDMGNRTRAMQKAVSDKGYAIALSHYLKGFTHEPLEYKNKKVYITKFKGSGSYYGSFVYGIKVM